MALFLLIAGCETSDTDLHETNGSSAPAVCFERHVIDGTGSGADGVHLGDINRDGHPDVVSGWEESADLKVYLHPGNAGPQLRAPWPSVDVSGSHRVADIEDAAFADLDVDGILDAVISATEGATSSPDNRRIRIHRWDITADVDDPGSWRSNAVYLDEPTERFMKVRSAQIDGRHGADIVALSRDLYDENDPDTLTRRGGVFLFTAPDLASIATPERWQRQRLADVGKGKSIELLDVDDDGDIDILYAGTSTIAWLENPGHRENPGNQKNSAVWQHHLIGAASDLALCDINGDGLDDVVATAGRKEFPVVAKWFQRTADPRSGDQGWQQHNISIDRPLPVKFYQLQKFALKSIACGNFGPPLQPGQESSGTEAPADIVITTSGSGHGIFLASTNANDTPDHNRPWTAAPVTPYSWIMKYDNILLVDMDADGDTDFVTSEENEGLRLRGAGVLWYENTACP